MTPQPVLKTIAIHTLPNISQSKRNQTMKIGQLTAYNNRNIFLQKLCDVLTYMLNVTIFYQQKLPFLFQVKEN